jgi:dipeptidyl aminopeptidase/acylaminoacyl peptidase
LTSSRTFEALDGWRSVVGVRASSPSLSPDGERVAYVSDRDGAPAVWIQRTVRGAAPVRVATGEDPVHEVRWSPDGEWLAVLVAPGGSPRTQVWLLRPDGSGLRRIAPEAPGATHLGPWARSPERLAFAYTTAPSEGVAALEHVASGVRQVVARGGQPLVLDADRTGRFVLVRRGSRAARTVWLVDLSRERETQLLPGGGAGSTDFGRLSPDGRVAYVRSDAGREMHALFAVTIDDGGTPGDARVLAERADADVEHLILTAGGGSAVLVWNCAGLSECEHLDVSTGERRRLPLPEAVVHDASFSRDGRRIAMTLEGPTLPRAVWLLDVDTSAWDRITEQPPRRRAAPAAPVAPTLERLRAEDGLELTGWLYRPPSARAPGPAVVHLHGGPEAQERPTHSPLFQALAAQGIAVFAPNVRGSSGFGRSFVDADNVERRWGAIADVAACARHLVSAGVAAPGRLACAGRSYGGYLTLAALVTHPDLFAGGVDVCGMADLQTFYANTEPWIAVAAYPKYGHPVHDAELLHALSPIHHMERLRAPLLVVHGRNDTNVPLEEAEQVVNAARSRGIPVELLVFEDEGHEILRAHNRVKFVEVVVEWLASRLRVTV